MNNHFTGEKLSDQGYVYNSFGKEKYLKFAAASVATLRRYDTERPVALFCSEEHAELIGNQSLNGHFDHVFVLPEENRSITGFKHSIHQFMPFNQNLFLDSDILWCRNPDALWRSLYSHPFTITGNQVSDHFFGGPKGLTVIFDYLLKRRTRTLKRFGLTYLSRVQSGMIYARDPELTRRICLLAGEMLEKRHRTHFRSRTEEKGRSEETCEWSLAMAMASLKVQVYPWLQGYNSPQLDYIEDFTEHNEDFTEVKCFLYANRFVYDLKNLKSKQLRNLLIRLITLLPGKGDYLEVTPYCLHFGWIHQKEPLIQFSESVWESITS
jgi:hypothetical protein